MVDNSVPKFFRTLFLPGLHGQYKMWRNDLIKRCEKSDKVIQFGNIIGCNEYARDENDYVGKNEGILKMVHLYANSRDNDSWIQLIGPNEILALNFPDQWTNKKSRKFLREFYFQTDPFLKIAGVDKNRLVTHGGLTYGEWLNLGKPDNASDTAELLNKKYYRSLRQGDCHRLTKIPCHYANPIWADPILEVYPSWIGAPEPMPFDQIHASGTINTEEGRRLVNNINSTVHYADHISFRDFGSIMTIKGMNITSLGTNLNGEMHTTIPKRPGESLYTEKSLRKN